MPRNVRGEILTAFVVVLLLLVVGLSAMLLSLVNTDALSTPIAGGGTETGVTSTPRLKSTLTPSVTNTPRITDTDTPSPTDTEEPTRTDTPSPTKTDTPTATETHTDTPTSTSIPRTRVSVRPTQTDTATPTDTEEPTATDTPSVTPTPILILLPTHTNTPTETQLPSPLPPPTSTFTPEPCSQPMGWKTYTVQRGNTLFSIARSVGSTVGELRTVNCIPDADNINVNQVLFVPRLPNRPVQTGVPRIPDSSVMRQLGLEGCGVPASSLAAPSAGQRIKGTFQVFGTASLDNFQYYKLEVRPDFTNVYNFYSRSDVPVVNGFLGNINADLFDDGLYWVKLTVVDHTGNFVEPCAIPVIFD